MRLKLVLQIGVATLVALSSALLGMGEQRATLPLAAVIIAFATVYVTDIQGWLRINTKTADALGVAAALLAVFQWQRDETDAGLLALLNFAMYGQIVLQLKHKGIGTYWLLIALSLMEAAVATALSESLAFGILLVCYVFAAITVLTVFYLYREQVKARRTAEVASGGSVPDAAPRAQNATQQTAFAGQLTQRMADESVNLPLARLIGNIGGMALGMACLVFGVIPRSERGAWREGDVEPTQRMVGFSSEVQLGELGAVSESAEEVMEVYLEDPDTKEPCELIDEPLFRGVVLSTYFNRKWKRELFAGRELFASRAIESRDPPPGTHPLTQRFVVRPLDTDVLFCMHPAYSKGSHGDILSSASGEELERKDRRRRGSIDYELLTTAVVDRRLSTVVPAMSALQGAALKGLLSLPTSDDGSDPLAGTKELAQRIVRNIPAENQLERARVLANYLRDPTNFRYSLEDVQRDPALDPVEDFVMQHRVGHCEYFASALTLMLRSVGIPARLAIGFKGGDWMGTYYQVRALDAHAWVEAYLAPGHLPERVPAGVDPERGAWLIVDPTGGGGESPASNVGSYVVEGFKRFLASVRNGWRTYVLGLNHARQQDAIYEPLRSGVISVLVGVTDRNSWKSAARTVALWVSPSYWGLTNGGWFSWRGALAAIVMMLTFLGASTGGRVLLRWLWRTSQRARSAERGRGEVEFYRRLEEILAERDLLRGASQTHREFALAVGGQLAESPHTKHAAHLARQIVELFYRVRFGRRSLDSQEAATVEQALSGLAAALSHGGGRSVQDQQ